jgi:hypothetical protein
MQVSQCIKQIFAIDICSHSAIEHSTAHKEIEQEEEK